MIQAIFFDFGRVLGTFDHIRTCRELTTFSSLSASEIYKRIFRSRLEIEYDEGQLSSGEFYEKVAAAIEARKMSFEDFRLAWGNIFKENNPIAERILKFIKPEIKIFVLSNTNEMHWQFIKQLPLMQEFFPNTFRQVLSFRVGARKPDKRIYQDGIQRTGTIPGQIVYIDDISEYVESFRTLGGNGIVFNCEEDLTTKLADELVTYDIL